MAAGVVLACHVLRFLVHVNLIQRAAALRLAQVAALLHVAADVGVVFLLRHVNSPLLNEMVRGLRW
jgi:hypothetical protein